MSNTPSGRPNIDHFYRSERIELEESTVEAHEQGNGSISFGEEAKGMKIKGCLINMSTGSSTLRSGFGRSPNGYMNGGWQGQNPYPPAPPQTWGGAHPSQYNPGPAPAQMPGGYNPTSPTPNHRGPNAPNQTLRVPRRDWDNDSIQETASNASSDDERDENTRMDARPDQPLANTSATTSTTATLGIRGQSSSTRNSSFSMTVQRTKNRRTVYAPSGVYAIYPWTLVTAPGRSCL
ncbi:hypothetical protein NLJ89_g3102 [Agrocybe chaxingu]|uniref:Uncharacterized protein n=1 Tax=Agrocybe chaxingu TaxID=84603 RepID=A0A9W8K4N1_9AGAR|nr:hypothetical protein NLJ89_g3102 [Agrocybe chaxingu]